MTGRQLRMTTSSTAGQRLIVEGRVFFALCAMPFFPALLRCRFCVYVYCVLTNARFRIWRATLRKIASPAPDWPLAAGRPGVHTPIYPQHAASWRCSWTLKRIRRGQAAIPAANPGRDAASPGGGSQRSPSSNPLTSRAGRRASAPQAAVAPCAIGRYRSGAEPQLE